MSHECYIGCIGYYDHYEMVTLIGLKDYIRNTTEFNELCCEYGKEQFKRKDWSLRDYADWRKNTNLSRFNYCPECGKKIDWGAIRREEPV